MGATITNKFQNLKATKATIRCRSGFQLETGAMAGQVTCNLTTSTWDKKCLGKSEQSHVFLSSSAASLVRLVIHRQVAYFPGFPDLSCHKNRQKKGGRLTTEKGAVVVVVAA